MLFPVAEESIEESTNGLTCPVGSLGNAVGRELRALGNPVAIISHHALGIAAFQPVVALVSSVVICKASSIGTVSTLGRRR